MRCGRSCTGAAVAVSCGVEEALRGPSAVRGNTGFGDLGVLIIICEVDGDGKTQEFLGHLFLTNIRIHGRYLVDF